MVTEKISLDRTGLHPDRVTGSEIMKVRTSEERETDPLHSIVSVAAWTQSTQGGGVGPDFGNDWADTLWLAYRKAAMTTKIEDAPFRNWQNGLTLSLRESITILLVQWQDLQYGKNITNPPNKSIGQSPSFFHGGTHGKARLIPNSLVLKSAPHSGTVRTFTIDIEKDCRTLSPWL